MSEQVYVLAMDVPGRYIVGLADEPVSAWRDRGFIHLTDPTHVTLINDRWTFQPITAMTEFVATLSFYAGFGVATAECETNYRAWQQYRKNPPDFGVEEPDSTDAA